MLKYFIIIASLLFIGSYEKANASFSCGDCINRRVDNNINANISSGENEIGKLIMSNTVTTPEVRDIKFDGPDKGVPASEWFVFASDGVSLLGSFYPNWNFKKIDDYVSIGVRYVSNCGVESYAPFNRRIRAQGPCSEWLTTNSTWYSRQFQTALRIDKKIVSGTYAKNILLGEYGICWPAYTDCRRKNATFMKLYVNLNLTVPQTCELNAGQVINIDFGNISSGAFKTAGAIAQGIQPKERTVSVKCDNIAGNSQLTMRLQANKANGNIVVSDENNDVGFRVTNNSGTPLIPNNLSSVIPFTLDSNARQNVTIQAYPVSVTGNKPAEGPVTSRAYLRVDFP